MKRADAKASALFHSGPELDRDLGKQLAFACAARRAPAARSAGSGRCSHCGRRRSGAWRPGSRRGRGCLRAAPPRRCRSARSACPARSHAANRARRGAARRATAARCRPGRAGRRARRCGVLQALLRFQPPAAERRSQVELAEQVRAAADTIGIDVELAAELRFDIELGEPGRRVRRVAGRQRVHAAQRGLARARSASNCSCTQASVLREASSRGRGAGSAARSARPPERHRPAWSDAAPQVGLELVGLDGERAGQRHLAPAPDELGLQDAHAGLLEEAVVVAKARADLGGFGREVPARRAHAPGGVQVVAALARAEGVVAAPARAIARALQRCASFGHQSRSRPATRLLAPPSTSSRVVVSAPTLNCSPCQRPRSNVACERRSCASSVVLWGPGRRKQAAAIVAQRQRGGIGAGAAPGGAQTPAGIGDGAR